MNASLKISWKCIFCFEQLSSVSDIVSILIAFVRLDWHILTNLATRGLKYFGLKNDFGCSMWRTHDSVILIRDSFPANSSTASLRESSQKIPRQFGNLWRRQLLWVRYSLTPLRARIRYFTVQFFEAVNYLFSFYLTLTDRLYFRWQLLSAERNTNTPSNTNENKNRLYFRRSRQLPFLALPKRRPTKTKTTTPFQTSLDFPSF